VLSQYGCFYLGEVSFGFYVFHMVVVWRLPRSLMFGHPLAFVALAFALVLGISVLCNRCYELPMRDRLNRAVAAKLARPDAPERAAA
jgi:peptidoglycan/LPS O-acetylase OafA/YrhL